MYEDFTNDYKFNFPSAEEFYKDKINKCIEYVNSQLEHIFKTYDLSLTNSFTISKSDFDIVMLKEYTEKILEGKGYDISIVDNGRSKGVVVKWEE